MGFPLENLNLLYFEYIIEYLNFHRNRCGYVFVIIVTGLFRVSTLYPWSHSRSQLQPETLIRKSYQTYKDKHIFKDLNQRKVIISFFPYISALCQKILCWVILGLWETCEVIGFCVPCHLTFYYKALLNNYLNLVS